MVFGFVGVSGRYERSGTLFDYIDVRYDNPGFSGDDGKT
jgi:hypothetical protein